MRYLKILLKIVAAFIALIIVSYLGIAGYIYFNKATILQEARTELNKSVDGKVEIGDIDPSFVVSFPAASILLENLLIKDHRWSEHRHTLLAAQKVYVSVNIFALFKRKIVFDNIRLNDATVDLYVDSTGYSNTSVFKSRKKDNTAKSSSGTSTGFRKFEFSNLHFIMENIHANKLFKFAVKKLRGRLKPDNDGWKMKLDMDMLVQSLAFNKDKGSFLSEKRFAARYDLIYNKEKSLLEILPGKTVIGKSNFLLNAQFGLGLKPVKFMIKLHSDALLWKEAASVLTPKIASKLLKFDLKNAIPVDVVIAGDFGRGSQPSIDVSSVIKNNVLKSPLGDYDQAHFTARFTNHVVDAKGNNDENSLVKVTHFYGRRHGIRVDIDSLLVKDLANPVLTSNVRTNFEMKNLNQAMGEGTLKFYKGRASLNLKYRAGIQDFQIVRPYVTGFIDLKDADLEFVPNRLRFNNTYVRLRFTENDLFLDNVRATSGRSNFSMKGSIRNFMNVYYDSPEKIRLNCDIYSNQLYINEFLGLLAARQRKSNTAPANGSFVSHLSDAIDKSEVDVNLHVDKIIYDKFVGRNVNAEILFARDAISINNVRVDHENGNIRANAKVVQKGDINTFYLKGDVNRVNVSRFFYAFNSFGIKGFNHTNLRGTLSSDINIMGKIGANGKLLHRSLGGSVIFNLSKAALIDFPPLQSIAKFAFPFRDFKNITFSDLRGRFDIAGEKVKISPMQISSSVLNMDMAGIYSFGKGTAIELDVPLRNPKKDKDITDPELKAKRRMKGLVLHIMAEDGDDGKIHFRWNGK